MVVHTITQNRYTTYALCLAVLCFTGYRALTNQINWVGNWPLWSAVQLERYQRARARPHGPGLEPHSRRGPGDLAAWSLTLALFRRREWDPIRVIQRLSPRPLVAGDAPKIALDGGSLCSRASGWRSR